MVDQGSDRGHGLVPGLRILQEAVRLGHLIAVDRTHVGMDQRLRLRGQRAELGRDLLLLCPQAAQFFDDAPRRVPVGNRGDQFGGATLDLVSVTLQIPPLTAPGYAQRIEFGDEGLGSRVRVASQVE